ncbi:MAG: hypothetical protein EAZ45_21480 [Oscillatoriales cyanobacterium]|nr:MAG: hypothetical protein EAZ45_21480 [Oscillatoriales cyanobacterium]
MTLVGAAETGAWASITPATLLKSPPLNRRCCFTFSPLHFIIYGHGAWGMGHGAWGMGHGAWGMGHGA